MRLTLQIIIVVYVGMFLIPSALYSQQPLARLKIGEIYNADGSMDCKDFIVECYDIPGRRINLAETINYTHIFIDLSFGGAIHEIEIRKEGEPQDPRAIMR